jgi:hypothetical protein
MEVSLLELRFWNAIAIFCKLFRRVGRCLEEMCLG